MVPRGTQIGNCGGIVHRVDRDAAGDGAGGARGTDQIRVGVGYRPGQGSAAGQGIAGRILVAVAEGHRFQHQRIVGQGVGSGKRQGAVHAVVTGNRDVANTGYRQRVIGRLQPAGDLHRGTGGLRIVHIGQCQTCRDRDRNVTFSETVVCGRNCRRIGGRRDGDGAAQGGCQRRRNGGTRIVGIGTVIQRNGELAGRVGVVNGRVIVTGIAVAQLRQQRLHCRRGGVVAGEGNGQVTVYTAAGSGGCKGVAFIRDSQSSHQSSGHSYLAGTGTNTQHRQRVSTDIGIKMNGQRTGAAGEKICRTIRIGNREGTAHELQRRGVLLGIGTAQSGRTHRRRIVVAHNGHTQRNAQGSSTAAISHGIGQRARCRRRIGGVLEGQVFEDALGNRSGSRTVQRDDKVTCRAAAGGADGDPLVDIVILDIAAAQFDVAINICCTNRQRNNIRRDQAADGDRTAVVARAVDIGQGDSLVDPVCVELDQVFVETLGIQIRQPWLIVDRINVDGGRPQCAGCLVQQRRRVIEAGVGYRYRHAAVAIRRVVRVVDVGDTAQQTLEVCKGVYRAAERDNRERSRACYIADRVCADMNTGMIYVQSEARPADVQHLVDAIIQPRNHQLHLRQIGVIHISKRGVRRYRHRRVRRVRKLSPGDAGVIAIRCTVQVHHRRIVGRSDGDSTGQGIGVLAGLAGTAGKVVIVAVVDRDAVGTRQV